MSATITDNPLLDHSGLPRYDLIKPEHVVPAMRACIERAEREFGEVEREAHPDRVLIQRLNQIEYQIERTWGPVIHLLGVKNSEELREAHETMQPEVVALGLRMGQSEPIYRALRELRDGEAFQHFSESLQRQIEHRLQSAEHAGVGLTGEKRERFNEIARELSQLSTEFSNHVLDATKSFHMDLTTPEEVDGLPQSALAMAAQNFSRAHPDVEPATPENGPWRFSLELPSFLPFMQHARNRGLREALYRAYVSRASSGELDNTPIIEQILKLRRERAGLLGFQTHAELSLSEKMADSVEDVIKLLEELRVVSFDRARDELGELQEFAQQNGEAESLKQWDIAFWSERLREKRFSFTEEELKQYFPLERALEGLFGLAERLFGVRIEPADGEATVWNSDVRFFAVIDEGGARLASFYLDPYSRPAEKRGGAWMGECLTRRRRPHGLEIPVAYIVCNGSPPVGGRPSLLTFRDVETIFHEFGHALQHMLTNIEDPDVSGINGVEWDAVELPSQFMENWCYHKATLLGMTRHVETGSPMPDDLFERVRLARTFRAASDMLRQLRFAFLDLELHHNFDPSGSTSVFDVQHRMDEKTSVMPPLPEDRFLCSFSHIFAGGYSAGYYSYKWAEVLSADAFSAFEEAGLDDEEAVRKTGRRFRETILGLGGSRHPMKVFRDFRGREPATEALLRHSGLAA
ncbi:MAG: M3 family metallopeptidase [Spirochaetales bacterium]|nr:M3 family metallopeptidase [Leptospiraceae bacterium]MCP5481079.1 M3 family metallopeptidase [Spirochaetales bacterium]MCP5485459.1 M3 family metallopeptidase [Spirochaetales bacterium]